ncbi:MAG: PH domain-containing protein [Polyangiaceae bacterium]
MTSEPSSPTRAPAVEPEKRRLHPAGVLVMVAARAKELFLLLVLAFFDGSRADGLSWFYVASISFVVMLGFVRWYRFRYWFEGDHFRVEDGAIVRKRAFIPLDKVQAVDISAGVTQRLLGLVKLEVKTGAAGTQAELTAITEAEARHLTERLQPDVVVAEASTEVAAPLPRKVYRMTTRELLLAGATSGQLAVVGAMVGWVLSRVEETLLKVVVDRAQSYASGGVLAPSSPYAVVVLVAVGFVVTWTLATLWSAAKFGNFTLERRGGNLVVRRGLVEQQQVTLPVERIQAVRYHESLMRQPLGYGALYVETVGHAEAEGKSSFLHPFIHRDAVRPLLAELLPQFDVETRFVRPPRRALRRFLVVPTTIVLVVVAIGGFLVSPWIGLGLAALPLVWLVGYVSWRDTGLSLGDDVAVVRSRGLRRTTAYLRRGTAQIARTTASLLQRRRRVATVHLTVATGVTGRTFSARDLDATQAWEAMRWVLPDLSQSDLHVAGGGRRTNRYAPQSP